MDLDLQERVRKLEHQVAYLIGRVNMKDVKARLKPKKHARKNVRYEKADAIREWMRKVVMTRDEDLPKKYLFTHPDGRRFLDYNYFCEKHMRTKAPFRDGQILANSHSVRTMVRHTFGTMGMPVIDYPKRLGLTTLRTLIEIPAYNRHPAPEYFEPCMTVAERVGVEKNDQGGAQPPTKKL